MAKKELLNLIKFYYIDMAIDIEESDEDEPEVTIDTLKIENNEELFTFVKDFIEEIVYDYLSEKMKINESEDLNLEVNYILDENLIRIEIQQIEITEDEERLDAQMTPSDMQSIRVALLTGKFEQAQSIFEKYVTKENNKLVAEKETSFFKWEVPLKIENYEDIDSLEANLLTCMGSFEESIGSELFEF